MGAENNCRRFTLGSYYFKHRNQRGLKSQSPLEKVVDAQLGELDTGEIERTLASIDAGLQAQLPSLDLKEIIFSGGGIEWGQAGTRSVPLSISRSGTNYRLLTGLLVLAVIGALLQNLQVSFSALTVSISLWPAASDFAPP